MDTVSLPESVVDGSPTDQLMTGYTHVHLPLLEQQGYIDWDRRHHEVTRGPRFDELRPLLDTIEEFDDS